MNVVIVGAGAMGSLFGALLSSVASVALLDPWEEHIREISHSGLRLTGVSGDRIVALPATCEPASLKPADLVIVFVKSHETEWAAQVAAAIVKDDGLVLTLQNGLGNSAVLERAVGRARASAGVTAHGATLLGPGQVRHAGKGPTHLGFHAANEARVRAVAKLFSDAGLEVYVSDDFDSLVWGKLVVNAGINALTAILRVPNGALARIETLRSVMDETVTEAVAVARAKGIVLPYPDPVAHVREVATRTGTNLSSMLQDVLRGTPTEVEVINGAIAREGAAVGVPTPANELLLRLVRGIEATYAERV